MQRICLSVVCLLGTLAALGFGAETSPVSTTESKWRDFTKQSFTFEGFRAFVVVPNTPAPGKPWIWRTSFPDFHAEVDAELVKQGFHIAHVDVVSQLGADSSLDVMDRFYDLVRKQWALAERPALEGVSRGGLHVYRYAARRPERIACIYADTPVMDLKTWPLNWPGSKAQVADAIKYYGFKSEEELKAFRGNPVDVLEPIAKAKIPIRHVISLSDTVVPPEKNTLEARRRLQKLGWDMDVVSVAEGTKASNGHHFPLPEVAETVQFIQKHANVGTAR